MTSQDEQVPKPPHEMIVQGRIREALCSNRLELRNLAPLTLPDSLGELIELRYLDISGNALAAVPESVRQLTNLETLLIHYNHLTALPDWLGQLTRLRQLYCGNNRLTILPQSLRQLVHLRELDLSHNWLSALPDWLGQLLTFA